MTAIVAPRGNGGRYFWRIEHTSIHAHDRIIKEALISLDIARGAAAMKDASAPEFGFEIHVDVGENGPTKPIIQEVVGIIRANIRRRKRSPTATRHRRWRIACGARSASKAKRSKYDSRFALSDGTYHGHLSI